MSALSTLAEPNLSPDVLAFAAEKGVTAYFPALIQLVRRIYPERALKIVLEDDPELSYNRTIVFPVDVSNMDPDTVFATTRQWVTGLFECCPATHVHAFGLDPALSS